MNTLLHLMKAGIDDLPGIYDNSRALWEEAKTVRLPVPKDTYRQDMADAIKQKKLIGEGGDLLAITNAPIKIAKVTSVTDTSGNTVTNTPEEPRLFK